MTILQQRLCASMFYRAPMLISLDTRRPTRNPRHQERSKPLECAGKSSSSSFLLSSSSSSSSSSPGVETKDLTHSCRKKTMSSTSQLSRLRATGVCCAARNAFRVSLGSERVYKQQYITSCSAQRKSNRSPAHTSV